MSPTSARSDDSPRLRREMQFHDRRAAEGDPRRALGFAYIGGFPAMEYYLDAVRSALETADAALELGSGAKPVMSDATRTAVGIDVSVESLRAARRVNPQSLCLGADAIRLPVRSDSIDLVLGQSILHHLPTAAALSEIGRILRPSGTTLFIEPLGHNPLLRVFRRFTPSLRTPDEHPLLRTDFAHFERHFATVRISYFDLSGLLAVPLARFEAGRRLRSGLNALDVRAARRSPLLGSYGWWAVIEASEPVTAATEPGRVPGA